MVSEILIYLLNYFLGGEDMYTFDLMSLVKKLELPEEIVNILEMSALGNSMLQYGLFAFVFLISWFVAFGARFGFSKVMRKFKSKIGEELTELLIKRLRFPILMIVLAAVVAMGGQILTTTPVEGDQYGHWLGLVVTAFFSLSIRLFAFLAAARLLEVIWDEKVKPWVEAHVEGGEKRFFPVIYRILSVAIWVTAVIYCTPVLGFDAVTIVNTVFRTKALHNTVGQYLAFIGLILATMLLGRTLFAQFKKGIKYVAQKANRVDDDTWFDGLEKPTLYLFLLFGFRLSVAVLTEKVGDQDGLVHGIVSSVVNVLIATNFTWIALILSDKIFDNFLIPLTSSKEDFDDQLLPPARKAVKVCVVVVGVIFVIKGLGKDPATVLAGLGIGGVAIGFAAKDTLSPFISGIAIYLTRPYAIGDYIVVDEKIEGTVQDIGLRATVLGTKKGTTYITPNDAIINSSIHNMTSSLGPGKDAKKGTFDGLYLRVDIAMNPKERDEAIQIFKDAVSGVEWAIQPAVHFLEYGDDNIGLFLSYWVTNPKHFWDARHEVMLHIDNHMRESRILMSTPTRALSFAPYLDSNRAQVDVEVRKTLEEKYTSKS